MTSKEFTVENYVVLRNQYDSVDEVHQHTEGMSKRQARALSKLAISSGLMRNSGDLKSKDDLLPPELQEGAGDVEGMETGNYPLPKKNKIKRYLLTCAQNNTKLHESLWANLLSLANHYEADLHVSRFSYFKSHILNNGDKSDFDDHIKKTKEDIWWDQKLVPYFSDTRIQLAPGLVWCGEMNTLPTAVRPLSGLDSYTGRNSGIFPHVKIAMESVPSAKNEGTKFNYTTGAITLRNYIQKKAGLKAEFHHCYGALLVEVDSDGDWFARQLNADHDGTIYDLDIKVENGKVTEGNRIEAVTWGDLHAIQADETSLDLGWRNENSVVNTLQPQVQFLHDVLDFRGRNHHESKNMHRRLEAYVSGAEDVRDEVILTLNMVRDLASSASDCQTIVVDSNHDQALERWLREADWQFDCVNVEFYLEAQLAKVRSILLQDPDFHLLEWCAREVVGADLSDIWFLREDESYIICQDSHGGIECGMHGHLGPNGSRGGVASFAKMGRKANVGHSHTAGIRDGVYVSGTTSEMDMGYNRGPSSWSHSHVITYPNGKRAILSFWKGKWRA